MLEREHPLATHVACDQVVTVGSTFFRCGLVYRAVAAFMIRSIHHAGAFSVMLAMLE